MMACVQVGLALSKHGEWDKALEAYGRAIERDGNLAVSYNNMGVLLSKMNKLEQARLHYETATRIDPLYADAQQNLLALLRSLNAVMELVALHKEASIRMAELAGEGQRGVVVAGYSTQGDGLGSHARYLMPELTKLAGMPLSFLDTMTDKAGKHGGDGGGEGQGAVSLDATSWRLTLLAGGFPWHM